MSEWTRPAQPVRCVVELDKPLTVRRERWLLSQGDANANAIVAEVYQTAGKPYDLTGCTVMLTFVRPDNLALPPIEAEISGNTAVATLKDACYEVSGVYVATMQLRKDGVERTILWLIGDVKGKDIDGIVDPDHEIISVEDLMVTAAEAQKAASAANAAAKRANAGADRVEQMQIDASGLAGDSNKLGGKAPEYYLSAVQLLDNSNFEIAQAGYNGTHGSVIYAADRWKNPNGLAVVKNADGLSITFTTSSSRINQVVDPSRTRDFAGKPITLAACVDGTVLVANGTVPSLPSNSSFIWSVQNNIYLIATYIDADIIEIAIAGNAVTKTINWASLYEGTYTAETLPPFVPSDATLELARCQEYYRKRTIDVPAVAYNDGEIALIVSIKKMRLQYTTINVISAQLMNASFVYDDMTSKFKAAYQTQPDSLRFIFAFPAETFVKGNTYLGRVSFEEIADL